MKQKKQAEKIFVKPGEFGSVRDPITMRMLKDEGEFKPRNSYWMRRVKQGDVVLTNEVRTSPKESKPKTEVKPTTAPKKGDQR